MNEPTHGFGDSGVLDRWSVHDRARPIDTPVASLVARSGWRTVAAMRRTAVAVSILLIACLAR
jgi:hypothetical protein